MPTLEAYRQEMYARDHDIGRVEAIASLTTTTIVVTSLSVGGLDAARFVGKWLIRPDATGQNADRVRRCTNYVASSGTLSQAGTNYADTTSTSENVEITSYEPSLLDAAVQFALQYLRKKDRTYLPSMIGTRRYWIGDLSAADGGPGGWIRYPSDVDRISWSQNPVLNRNQNFEKWNTYNSSGVLQPDFWTLAGASATVTRSTAQNLMGTYTAALLRSGADATLTTTPGIQWNGVSGDSVRSQTLTFGGMAWASSASKVRFGLNDGVSTTYTSYHTGDSTWQELTATKAISASASTLQLICSVDTGDTTGYFDRAFVLTPGSAMSDAIRRNQYPEYNLSVGDWKFDQGSGPLQLILPMLGAGRHFNIYSRRPFPQFVQSRITGGTADLDSSDAPLAAVACIAIGRVYDGLADEGNSRDQTKYSQLAARWYRKGEQLAALELYEPENPRGGLILPRSVFGPPAAQFRVR